jgi:two-component system, chemotaxis family, sensor kinase Cph1
MERQLRDVDTLRGLCQAIADAVRSATGFDRVMVYRFEPSGDGVVDAESRCPDIESFLGLHYPASDIPKQARALFLKSWLRMIPDVSYTASPLHPVQGGGRVLDLSQTSLRSVSPVHLEYLVNMGVAATMTISIVRQGQLWGLIACHHRTPRHVPLRLRVACELFAEMASLRLEARLAIAETLSRMAVARALESITSKLAPIADLAEGLQKLLPSFLNLIPASGITLYFEGSDTSIGQVPNPAQIANLVTWLNTRSERLLATDHLVEMYPPADEFSALVSGLLAVSISRVPGDYVLFFMPEIVRTVTWGGNPQKPVQMDPTGKRLTPRASFAAWQTELQHHSRRWDPIEIEAANSLRVAIIEVIMQWHDVVAAEQAAARRQQDMLMAELDHRVKNILATIQALLIQSETGEQTLPGFLESFSARLTSMGHAHSLLTKNRWEGASLRDLVSEEMAPFMGGGSVAVAMDGPETAVLRPKASLAISLGLHELATNAAKYGALSRPEGRVHITWHSDPASVRSLVFEWRETGGPVVTRPTKIGFGLTLIEKSLAYEIGGEVTLDFPPEGLVCRVVVPWDQLVGTLPVPARPASPTPETLPAGLDGLRVLLVEDNALIAQLAVNLLQGAGATIVGPAARLNVGFELAENEHFDAAMLDIDLDGERVWPIADILVRRNIPFLFVTGFGADLVLSEKYAGRPVLNKPYKRAELVHALEKLMLRTLF